VAFEAAGEDLGSLANQLLGLGAADIGARFGVGAQQLDVVAEILEDRHRQHGTALAGLADQGQESRPRQQDAQLEGRCRTGAQGAHTRCKGDGAGCGADGEGATPDAGRRQALSDHDPPHFPVRGDSRPHLAGLTPVG
jgi:hypothetical protein